MGHFDEAFFERIQTQIGFGYEFFVWWNKERDAQFYKNAAINMILCDINWLLPQNEFEAHDIKTALDCLAKARELSPEIELPIAEWINLAELADNKALHTELTTQYPNAGEPTKGYKRGLISTNSGGWRFTHAGKMHFMQENDSTMVFWDNQHTIRVTTLDVEFNEKTSKNQELLLNDFANDEKFMTFIGLRNPKIKARIAHQAVSENGETMQETTLAAVLDDSVMLISIFYEDESWREIAISICASVAR